MENKFSKIKKIGKNISIFISLWLVCLWAVVNISDKVTKNGSFIISLAATVLIAFVWEKVSSRFLEK